MFNYEKSQENLHPQELFDLSEKDFLLKLQEQITLEKNGFESLLTKFPLKSFLTVFTKRFITKRSDYQDLESQVENGKIIDRQKFKSIFVPIFEDEIKKQGISI